MTRYRDTVVQLLGGIHDRLVSKVVDGAEAGDQTIVEGVRRAKVSSGTKMDICGIVTERSKTDLEPCRGMRSG
jgi:hypothetical protein